MFLKIKKLSFPCGNLNTQSSLTIDSGGKLQPSFECSESEGQYLKFTFLFTLSFLLSFSVPVVSLLKSLVFSAGSKAFTKLENIEEFILTYGLQNMLPVSVCCYKLWSLTLANFFQRLLEKCRMPGYPGLTESSNQVSAREPRARMNEQPHQLHWNNSGPVAFHLCPSAQESKHWRESAWPSLGHVSSSRLGTRALCLTCSPRSHRRGVVPK